MKKKYLIATAMLPIYKFSSVFFKSIEELRKKEKLNYLTYGTQGNPNSIQLSKRILEIEKGRYNLLTNSGLSSIFLCYFSLLLKNDFILVPDNLYEPHFKLLKKFKKNYGIKILIYDPLISYKQLINKFFVYNIKIVFVEAPGSITFETPNITDILKFSKKKKCFSIIDNTFSSCIGYVPLVNGFDISIQALTKFYSGNNDLLMGSITLIKKSIYLKLKSANKILGFYVSSFDCYLVLRNIDNVKYRYILHAKKMLKVIDFLKKDSNIELILNPFIDGCPGNKNWVNNFIYTSGLFSIIFKKNISNKSIVKFVDSLKIFNIGYSWGGSKSMVMLYEDILDKRYNFKKYRGRYLVRFFIGLDKTSNLIIDIKNALSFIY